MQTPKGAGASGAGGAAQQKRSWYFTTDEILDSPSLGFLLPKVKQDRDAAILREQEYRGTSCAFLQACGQKLRLCAAAPLTQSRAAPSACSALLSMHCLALVRHGETPQGLF